MLSFIHVLFVLTLLQSLVVVTDTIPPVPERSSDFSPSPRFIHANNLSKSPLSGLVNLVDISFPKSASKTAPKTWWQRKKRAMSCRRSWVCRISFNVMIRRYVHWNPSSTRKNQKAVYKAVIKHFLYFAEVIATAQRVSQIIIQSSPPSSDPQDIQGVQTPMPGAWPSPSSSSSNSSPDPSSAPQCPYIPGLSRPSEAPPSKVKWTKRLARYLGYQTSDAPSAQDEWSRRLGKLLIEGTGHIFTFLATIYPCVPRMAFKVLSTYLLDKLKEWNLTPNKIPDLIYNLRVWEAKELEPDMNGRATKGILKGVERYLKLETPEEMVEGRKYGIDNIWRSKMSGGHFLDASYATMTRYAFDAIEPTFRNLTALGRSYLQRFFEDKDVLGNLKLALPPLQAQLTHQIEHIFMYLRILGYVSIRRASYLALNNPFRFKIKGPKKINEIPGVRLEDLASQALYYTRTDCLQQGSSSCPISVDMNSISPWIEDTFIYDDKHNVLL
ncbi:MAG: hypothetical protein DHS80DRAFT_21264 [Piptocephalis tieghemiana]|nr:MAG: hypothetical protein DHS80DRAFT_21264 [Piptocephalis tieghemiana]